MSIFSRILLHFLITSRMDLKVSSRRTLSVSLSETTKLTRVSSFCVDLGDDGYGGVQ